jgi:hypothetical protein
MPLAPSKSRQHALQAKCSSLKHIQPCSLFRCCCFLCAAKSKVCRILPALNDTKCAVCFDAKVVLVASAVLECAGNKAEEATLTPRLTLQQQQQPTATAISESCIQASSLQPTSFPYLKLPF